MLARAPPSELPPPSQPGDDPISWRAARTSAEGEPRPSVSRRHWGRSRRASNTPDRARGARGVLRLPAAASSPVREPRKLDSVVVAEFALH